MAASATSANSGGKTHSPVTLPMSVQPHHQQQQQHQQQHHMQAIPSSAAAAAAAAVAAAAQLAAAAQMTNGSGSRLLQAPPPTSSPHEPLQPTQQTQLAPLPSWAYGHPALLPVDPQTESLTENWRQFQQAAYNYNLDPHMLAAMYGGGPGAGGGGIGFGQHPLHHHHHHHHPHHPHPHRSDLSARRKNATRETTSILKAWLNEHKKNPYPTKGEKIMLAIITTMTLTQVSTWFANARRRLKKENKMTWVPRNRPDEEDDDEEDAPSTTAASAAAAAAIDEDNNDDFDEDYDIAIDVGGGGALDADNDEDHLRPKIPMSIHGHQSFINQRKRPIQQLDETAAKAKSEAPSGEDPVAKAKPRIWSIVDTLNKTEPRQLQPPMLPQTRLQIPQPLPPLPPMPHQFQHHGQHLNQQSTFGFFGQHPKLPMTAGHQCGMQPPPPPPPPHHQLLMPPLYYSLFNAFNNRPTPSAAAAAATAAFGDSSPEPKCSPALDQPTGI